MKRALGYGPSLMAVVSLLVVGAGACEKSDQLLSAVDADRVGWEQRTSSLKARANTLDQRLQALPVEPAGAPMARVAQRRRVAALVVGSRQSLFDLDRNIDDSVREVKAAIRRGDNEGEQALTAAAETINGYVSQQEQGLGDAEKVMLQMEAR